MQWNCDLNNGNYWWNIIKRDHVPATNVIKLTLFQQWNRKSDWEIIFFNRFLFNFRHHNKTDLSLSKIGFQFPIIMLLYIGSHKIPFLTVSVYNVCPVWWESDSLKLWLPIRVMSLFHKRIICTHELPRKSLLCMYIIFSFC